MNWTLFTQLGITLITAAVGAWIGHRLATHRDLVNERRKLRIAYLLEAYRRLEFASNRDRMTNEQQAQFEQAFADVILLGSNDQVEAITEFARKKHTGIETDMTPVLMLLREDLRQELQLKQSSGKFIYLRLLGEMSVKTEPTNPDNGNEER